MLVEVSSTSTLPLHSYTHTSGQRGWLIKEMVGDGLPRRDALGIPNSMGGTSYGLIRTPPRQWQIIVQVWGRSYEQMQIARGELTALFARQYGQVTVRARISTSYAWREIEAICTGIDWAEDNERVFSQTATINLFSANPYWRYSAGNFSFTPAPVLSTNYWVRLDLGLGSVTTTSAALTPLRRVHYDTGYVLSFVGSASTTQVWQINNAGGIYALGSLPASAGSIGGICVVGGTLVAGAQNNITDPYFWWNGTSWIQPTTGMNGGVRRIRTDSGGLNHIVVCGLMSAPRKLLNVFVTPTSPVLVTSYEDIWTDLSFSLGEAACTDAYVRDSIIVGVARRIASPFVRWLRAGSLSGRTDIASWNANSDENFPSSIDGFNLHDLFIGGTFFSMSVGVTGLNRAARLRNLGGVEIAGDQGWTTPTGTFAVRRIGSRMFAHTANGSGTNWLLMWTGGGWCPIMWANDIIQDVSGDDVNIIAVGNFTQVQAFTNIALPTALSGVAAADMTFAPGTSGTFHGAVWSDGEGAMVVPPSGLSVIPSFVGGSYGALGTDYYKLAQGRDRTSSSVGRQLVMLRNVTGANQMAWTGYVEDWRM